jgi:hypothetical protein
VIRSTRAQRARRIAWPDTGERNRALVADYLGGMSRPEVAAKYGLTRCGVDTTLRRLGVRLSDDERLRRFRALSQPRSPGRRRFWADCPPELATDYDLLRRKKFTSAEARALLDPGFAA